MNPLGLYFGPRSVGIVQTAGKKISRSIQIPRASFSDAGSDEKVPDEVKIVALFNDEFRKANISLNSVSLSLSGKDLIIRTFEMPVLPKDELQSAVAFEAKKYIPFKIDELVYDYQIYFDRTIRKNLVLLVGIKKDILGKYLSIFAQLNKTVSAIEYSAFTVVRLLKVAGMVQQGVTAIVNADSSGEDEINFIVLHNGFPLFSRDIVIADEDQSPQDTDPGNILEKLKSELRVSLDFYKRKFPSKNIEKIYFIAPDEFRAELEMFLKDRSLACRFLDVKKLLNSSASFSLSILKAYGGSLAKLVKIPLKIDLLAARLKLKSAKEKAAAAPKIEISSLVQGFQFNPRVIFLGLLICAIAFGIGMYQKYPVQQELNNTISKRPQVTSVSGETTFEEITSVNDRLKNKIKVLSDMINKQFFVTRQFDSLPKLLPEGIWLKNIYFAKEDQGGKASLNLTGYAFLKDSVKELQVVNEFLSNLKSDSNFSGVFKNITIISVDQNTIGEDSVTSFQISCTN